MNVKLSRSNRIYRSSVCFESLSLFLAIVLPYLTNEDEFENLQELVEGKIVIKSPTSISHQGIRLSVNGSVNLQVSDSRLSLVFN